MKFDTNCEAHDWPEPQDGWCPICIMNESDDVKRQRDQLADALKLVLFCDKEDVVYARTKARAALQQLEEE